jgi:hypothetical protein
MTPLVLPFFPAVCRQVRVVPHIFLFHRKPNIHPSTTTASGPITGISTGQNIIVHITFTVTYIC